MDTQEIIDGMDAQQKQFLLMGVTCACNIMDLYSQMVANRQVYHFKKELEDAGYKVYVMGGDHNEYN